MVLLEASKLNLYLNQMHEEKNVKILIIRLSSIGDIVLTTPIVRCIKLQKKFEIHFLTKPKYFEIIKNNPYIFKVHFIKDSLLHTGTELAKENFDYVVDLHKNLRTAILKKIIKPKNYIVFDKINFKKWMAVNFKSISLLPNKHIVDRYFEAVKKINVMNDEEGLDFFVSNDDFTNAKKIINLPENYIAWAIGAQHFTKRYPKEKIIQVADKLSIPIVLLGDKNDEKISLEIINNSKNKNIINACSKLTLNQSATVVKNAILVISNDTGLMHIAAAFKKPVISFWGNTIPQFGMYPYYGKHLVQNKIFQVENLSCRPCSKIGFNQCPKKHFKCMNDINPNLVIEAINTFAQY